MRIPITWLILTISISSWSLPRQPFKANDLSLRLLNLSSLSPGLPEFRPVYEYKYLTVPVSFTADYRPLGVGGEYRHMFGVGGHWHFIRHQSAEFYVHLPHLYFLLNPPGDPDFGITLPLIAGWGNRFGPVSFKVEFEILRNSISFISNNEITKPLGLGIVFYAGYAF